MEFSNLATPDPHGDIGRRRCGPIGEKNRAGPRRGRDLERLVDPAALVAKYHAEQEVIRREADKFVGSFPVDMGDGCCAIARPFQPADENFRQTAGMAFSQDENSTRNTRSIAIALSIVD